MRTAFGPDAERARDLDQRVRAHLADSLTQLAAAIGGEIGFSTTVASSCAETVLAAPVRPAVFGLYADLVEAAFGEDRDLAATHAAALALALNTPPPALRLLNLADAELGDGQAQRYRRLAAGDEPGVNFPMSAVTAAERARAGALLAEALALLDEAAPAISHELRALVREVVAVHSEAPAGDPEALVFDGAATFYLWGAVLLNTARQRDRLSMAVALVHEAAHGLLFGITLGAPLVENDDAERFASPLRHDPRPMDGIVHATYVLARMIDCLERLLAGTALRPEERAAAAAMRARHLADYQTGLRTALPGARFTPEGGATFAAMRAAMRAATDAAATA